MMFPWVELSDFPRTLANFSTGIREEEFHSKTISDLERSNSSIMKLEWIRFYHAVENYTV